MTETAFEPLPLTDEECASIRANAPEIFARLMEEDAKGSNAALGHHVTLSALLRALATIDAERAMHETASE